MADITYFFSYAREDSEFVLRLATDLRAAGADIWVDQLDILGGQRWDSAVERALGGCRGVIAVLSPESVGSTNVMDEVSYALGHEKLVIPVLVRSCEIPFRLRRLQYVDFTRNFDSGRRNLLRALGIQEQASTLDESDERPSANSRAIPPHFAQKRDAAQHAQPTDEVRAAAKFGPSWKKLPEKWQMWAAGLLAATIGVGLVMALGLSRRSNPPSETPTSSTVSATATPSDSAAASVAPTTIPPSTPAPTLLGVKMTWNVTGGDRYELALISIERLDDNAVRVVIDVTSLQTSGGQLWGVGPQGTYLLTGGKVVLPSGWRVGDGESASERVERLLQPGQTLRAWVDFREVTAEVATFVDEPLKFPGVPIPAFR